MLTRIGLSEELRRPTNFGATATQVQDAEFAGTLPDMVVPTMQASFVEVRDEGVQRPLQICKIVMMLHHIIYGRT